MIDGPARTLCFLSIVPAMFLMLKIFFMLDWTEGGVGFAMAAIAWVVSVLAGNVILGRVIAQAALTHVRTSLVSVDHGHQANASTGASANKAHDAAVTSAQPSDDQTLSQFRDMVNQKISLTYSSVTREELSPDVDDMHRRLQSLRLKYQADPQFGKSLDRPFCAKGHGIAVRQSRSIRL